LGKQKIRIKKVRMNYSNILKSDTKFFLTGICALLTFVYLNAEEVKNNGIYYKDSVIIGKEYLYIGSALKNKDSLQVQNKQPNISISDSSYIFIAENAKIYVKDHLYFKQNTDQQQDSLYHAGRNKNLSRVAEKKAAKNSVAKTGEEPVTVFPVSPFPSSSASYLQDGKNSAIIVSQQRINGHQTASKANRGKAHLYFGNTNLSLFLSEQRQKLSTTATQCGILTSFSPNSPTVV